MKFRSSLSFLSSIVVIVLIILNGCLLKQNISYSNKNRELILQNDSLIAVMIELHKDKTDTLITQKLDKPILNNRK